MEIIEESGDRKKHMALLLLGDEDEKMLRRYIDKGDMFLILKSGNVIGECIVNLEDNVAEIMNIAIIKQEQRKGYGKDLIRFVEERYMKSARTLKVRTGDSPATLQFYLSCGFEIIAKVRNHFVENYEHPIYECGKRLTDMLILEKKIVNSKK